MTKDKKSIEFLDKLANILSKKVSPSSTLGKTNKLFQEYLGVNSINIVIWDNNHMLLKDFVSDSKILDDEAQMQSINYIYSSIAMSGKHIFRINDSEFPCEIDENTFNEINYAVEEENTVYYPLITNAEIFGLIKINNIQGKLISKAFLEVINISAKLLSGAISNYILNEQMEISLNFYKAMKDIAKIIESQYELSYIIPLIGEMIDRFISSHLIYIFIYKDDKYQLVWPNACKDKQVYSMLNKLGDNKEYIISDDSKIGIFPITSENDTLGAIVAYSNIDKLLQKDIDYLMQLTRQSGMTIQRANVYAEVLKYATMDALTGLNNRRQFEIRLNQEVSNAKRNNITLCAMMLDVDYFKKVNDTYGHAAGDCVLKNVADIIKKEIREYDIACRYGGEEFFIILPNTGINEANLVAQRLRKVIENSKTNVEEAGVQLVKYIKITVSIGICAFDPSMTADSFAQKADKALYKAKTTGRNRVIVG